jgi:hypothetical protein
MRRVEGDLLEAWIPKPATSQVPERGMFAGANCGPGALRVLEARGSGRLRLRGEG